MVVDAATGSTILNTAAALPIETARPQIDLVARHGAISSTIARPARGNRLDGKAETCQATARELAVAAIGLEALALATGQVEAEQIALEVVIFLAAAAETGTPSAEVPAVITDRVLDPTAVAARPAWDPEVEAVGAGRRTGLRQANYREHRMKSTCANGKFFDFGMGVALVWGSVHAGRVCCADDCCGKTPSSHRGST
jgi:hypothetical protein